MSVKELLQCYLATLEVGQQFTLADIAANEHGRQINNVNSTLNKLAYKGELVRKAARPQDHSGAKYHKGVATWAKL